MIEAYLPYLKEVAQNFRLADAADIVVISVLVYFVLKWLKEKISKPVLVVVSLLVLLYFLSETFGMFMTSFAFQAIFTVLLFTLIVVFQDDVKRAVQLVSSWSLFRTHTKSEVAPSYVDSLVEVSFGLSERRFGALLVLAGKEPIERHLEGGTLLEGKVSKPLLYSVFDPHSPGHDGAVVIVGDRVENFSVHLPLSKNREEVGDLGTRHSAAIGLSEVADATIVVVSEETGQVSLAQQGRLTTMKSPADLKTRIEESIHASHPGRPEARSDRFFTRNGVLKLISVMLAVLAWFLFAFQVETVERTFAVPIEYRSVPKDLRLGARTPSEAKVTLSGSEREFLLLKPGNLKISLDLSEAKEGRRFFPVTEKNLNCPSNLSVFRIDPKEVRLEILK